MMRKTSNAGKRAKPATPLVDAGMRELLATGFMHNRVRMVVASFFCKHLLLDWRLGERHFAPTCWTSNWQRGDGSGLRGLGATLPYFRVFNPTRNSKSLTASTPT